MKIVFRRKFKGATFVAISASSFGFLPIFAKFAYSENVLVNQFLFFRFLLGSFFILTFLILRKKFLFPDTRKLLYFLILGGMFYFGQSSLYLTSILFIPVSVAVLILYTNPVFVAIFSRILHFERPGKGIAISSILAIIGLFLITNPIFNVTPIGVILALSASLVYTGYILFSSRAIRNFSEENASFYITLSSSFSFFLYMTLAGNLNLSFNYKAWLWIILVSLISTSIAITTFLQGIKLIGPTLSSLLSLIEPITSILASFIIFNESFAYLQWLGVILIFIAIINSLR